MRKILTAALTAAVLTVGMAATANAFTPGPGGFAPGGGGPPPPPPPGFGGPGGFATPTPPGGGGGGGIWPMPPSGPKWGGSFGITIAPPIYAVPAADDDYMRLHIAYCLKRWKTYDPETDMFMSTKGPRYCVSPYSPYL